MLRSHQLQWIALGQQRTGPLDGRDERRQRRLPHRDQCLAEELDLATSGREHTIAEWSAIVGVRRSHESDATKFVDVDVGHRVANGRHVVVEQRRLGVAHRPCQAAEDLAVADRFTARLDRRIVPTQPEMSPRRDDIGGFDLRRRRQHDVGIARRVGDELFVHDGEEVVAHHAGADLLAVRRDHQWIASPHHHRPDRRTGRFRQDLAETTHVDPSRPAVAEQLGPGESGAVDQ